MYIGGKYQCHGNKPQSLHFAIPSYGVERPLNSADAWNVGQGGCWHETNRSPVQPLVVPDAEVLHFFCLLANFTETFTWQNFFLKFYVYFMLSHLSTK